MNRTKKEELRKFREARAGLTPEQILERNKIEELEKTVQEKACQLYNCFFPEESDFMSDSNVEAKERRKGNNPMSREYIDRIDQRRDKMGVNPLEKNGLSITSDTRKLCEKIAYRMHTQSDYTKKILYIDMDNVLVDFPSGIDQLSQETQEKYEGRLDEVPGIFSLMKPMKGAIKAIEELSEFYDIYILSTAPWENPSAWSDKLLWIKKYLPVIAYKRLILSHNKHLNQGDYLVDDRTKNGAGQFRGEHIHFLTERFMNWDCVYDYLLIEFVKNQQAELSMLQEH